MSQTRAAFARQPSFRSWRFVQSRKWVQFQLQEETAVHITYRTQQHSQSENGYDKQQSSETNDVAYGTSTLKRRYNLALWYQVKPRTFLAHQDLVCDLPCRLGGASDQKATAAAQQRLCQPSPTGETGGGGGGLPAYQADCLIPISSHTGQCQRALFDVNFMSRSWQQTEEMGPSSGTSQDQ